MKLILIGSHLCQDTLYALNKLKDYKVEIDFQDISSSFPALKLFLNKREHEICAGKGKWRNRDPIYDL